MRRAVVALLVAAVMGATGCSDDGTPVPGACEVLTRETAEQVLGEVADLPTSSTEDFVDENFALSSCSYLEAEGTKESRRAFGVVVRAALSEEGERLNTERFADPGLPEDAQPVEGYGDQAFWAPSVGQLNVLVDGDWVIVTFGGLDPRNHSLEETREAADVLSRHLTRGG